MASALPLRLVAGSPMRQRLRLGVAIALAVLLHLTVALLFMLSLPVARLSVRDDRDNIRLDLVHPTKPRPVPPRRIPQASTRGTKSRSSVNPAPNPTAPATDTAAGKTAEGVTGPAQIDGGVLGSGRPATTRALQFNGYCHQQQAAGKPIPADCHMLDLASMRPLTMAPDDKRSKHGDRQNSGWRLTAKTLTQPLGQHVGSTDDPSR